MPFEPRDIVVGYKDQCPECYSHLESTDALSYTCLACGLSASIVHDTKDDDLALEATWRRMAGYTSSPEEMSRRTVYQITRAATVVSTLDEGGGGGGLTLTHHEHQVSVHPLHHTQVLGSMFERENSDFVRHFEDLLYERLSKKRLPIIHGDADNSGKIFLIEPATFGGRRLPEKLEVSDAALGLINGKVPPKPGGREATTEDISEEMKWMSSLDAIPRPRPTTTPVAPVVAAPLPESPSAAAPLPSPRQPPPAPPLARTTAPAVKADGTPYTPTIKLGTKATDCSNRWWHYLPSSAASQGGVLVYSDAEWELPSPDELESGAERVIEEAIGLAGGAATFIEVSGRFDMGTKGTYIEIVPGVYESYDTEREIVAVPVDTQE